MGRFASWSTWRGDFVLDSEEWGSADTADLLGTGFAAWKSTTINYDGAGLLLSDTQLFWLWK